MIRLEDESTTADNSSPPLNDLNALKNTKRRSQASTPLSITMAELVTAIPGSPNGITFLATDIKLHSPSKIIGTPSDPSSRFEYPFPSPQLESESRKSLLCPLTKPPNLPPFRPPSSVRRRPSFVHPKHEILDVPVPPGLDKRMVIELRFPRPLEGANVLGETQLPIKRRENVDVPSGKS